MQKFAILTVCSGNICRSPMAEQLLRAALSHVPEVTVSSAGTIAQIGDEMPAQAQALSRSYGGDPAGHVPRQLSEKLVSEAQLVFAMSREHRREIVSLVPRASRYSFTIREFARLTRGLTVWDLVDFRQAGSSLTAVDRLGALVELAASRRGLVEPAETPEDDDVIDPFRRDDAIYALSGTQLAPAVSGVVTAMSLALSTDYS